MSTPPGKSPKRAGQRDQKLIHSREFRKYNVDQTPDSEGPVTSKSVRDALLPGLLGAVGLVAIVGLAGRFGIPNVERHLTADVERHVQTKTLGVQVRFDGRDAVLSGQVQTVTDREELRSQVAQRWGVRKVSVIGVAVEEPAPDNASEPVGDEVTQARSNVPTVPAVVGASTGLSPDPTAAAGSTTTTSTIALTIALSTPPSTTNPELTTKPPTSTSTVAIASSSTVVVASTAKPTTSVKSTSTTSSTSTTKPATSTSTSLAVITSTTGPSSTVTATSKIPTTTAVASSTTKLTPTTTAPGKIVVPVTTTTAAALAFDPNIVAAQINFVLVDQPIDFVDSSVSLRPGSNVSLDLIASLLAGAPNARFGIEVHTDGRGAPANNLTLSKRRGEVIRSALVSRGVASGRLVVDGRGEAEPLADNGSPQGQSINRRVLFSVAAA
jgi:outer membrane protein OmpA-like peptidoglycan-associated protein